MSLNNNCRTRELTEAEVVCTGPAQGCIRWVHALIPNPEEIYN